MCVFISLFSYLQLSVLSVLIYIIFYVHDDKYPYHTCLSIYRQRWHSSRLNAAKVLQSSSLELSKFRFCLMAAGSLPEQKQVKNSFNRQNWCRIDAVFRSCGSSVHLCSSSFVVSASCIFHLWFIRSSESFGATDAATIGGGNLQERPSQWKVEICCYKVVPPPVIFVGL